MVANFLALLVTKLSSFYFILSHICGDTRFISSVSFGLMVAFLVSSTAFIITCGLMFCLLELKIAMYKKTMRYCFLVFHIPIVIPYALSAVLIFLLYLPHGFWNYFVPPFSSSLLGVVIAYVYKVCPFMLLSVFPQFIQIQDKEYKYFSLYSNNSYLRYRYLLFPRIIKPLCVVGLIIFSYVFAGFDIPFVLGSGINKMPAIIIMEQMNSLENWENNLAYWMGAFLFCCILAFVFLGYIVYKTSLCKVKQ